MVEETRVSPPGWKRLAVVLSIFIYMIAGIPLWWKFTEIYRAALPFAEIEAFAHQVSSNPPSLPCSIQVVLHPSVEFCKHSLLKEVYRMLRIKLSNSCGQNIVLSVTQDAGDMCLDVGDRENATSWSCRVLDFDVFATFNDDVVDESLQKMHNSDPGAYTIFVLGAEASNTNSIQRSVIGKYRNAWITGAELESSHRLVDVLSEIALTMLRGSSSQTQRKVQPMPLSADATAILSFSLLNGNPEDWIFNWDFNEVANRYLSPIIEKLAPLAQLTIESQVLYYTPKAARSRWHPELNAHIINSNELSFFVNSNEWHLDTSTAAAGRSKILHMAIYIPAFDECPLHFRLPNGNMSTTDGFTSPGWGGVVVWNPPNCDYGGERIQKLRSKDLVFVLQVVVAQLRTLLGLPYNKKSNIHIIPDVKTGFTEWELDILLRKRVAADITASASTLSSLSRLVQSLPKMVIKEEIGVHVRNSLEAAISTHNATYQFTADAGRKGRSWAEAAFFHPSIMSLLHFPKEHLFAIYTPFFVPVFLHTLMSVFKEITRFYRENRKLCIAQNCSNE